MRTSAPIRLILLLLLTLSLDLFAKYECIEPRPISNKVDLKGFVDYQKSIDSANYFTDTLFGNRGVSSTGLRLCRGVYEVDEKTGKPTNTIKTITRAELTKLDFSRGSYECTYYDAQNNKYVCNDKSALKFVPYNLKRLSQTYIKRTDINEDNDNRYMPSGRLYSSIGKLWDGEQAIDMGDFANTDMVGRVFKNRDLHNTAESTFTESMADAMGLWNGKGNFFSDEPDFRLSDFVIGTILLDDEVIAGTDAYGAVELTKKVEDSLILTRFADEMGDDIFSSSGLISASSVFDRGALGLYVEMFDAVMLFFGVIMWSLMGYSTLYFVGTFGGSRIVHLLGKADKTPPEPFDYRSKGASILLVFSLMFIPQESAVKVNSGASFSNSGDQGEERRGTDTTFGKNIMNFFASEGTQFANRFSDLVMVRYLNYLANNFNVSSTQAYLGTLHDLKEQSSLAKAKVSFYRDYCADAYLNGSGSSSFLEGGSFTQWSKAIDPKWMYHQGRGGAQLFDLPMLYGRSYAERLRGRDVWVDVSPRLCQRLEGEIQHSKIGLGRLTTTATRIMEHEANSGGFKSSVEKLIGLSPIEVLKQGFASLTEEDNAEARSRDAIVGSFILSQMANQKMYGYWNVVTLPILDIYMRMTSAYGSLDDATKKAVSDVSHFTSASATSILDVDAEEGAKALNKAQLEEIIKAKEGEDIDEGTFQKLIGHAVTMSLYFFMPGFEGVWQLWKSIIDSAGTLTLAAVSVFFSGPTGGLSIAGFGVLSFVAMPAIKAILALWLSTATYIILIKFLSMVLVMLFIFIKLWQMILDVIKYFFSSPAVFLMELRQNNGQAIGQYVGRGFILLLIKPMMLVLVVVIFLSSYAVMLTAYDLLVDLGATLLSSANEVVDYSNEASTMGAMSAGIMTHAVRPFFDVIFHLFSIWVGYSVIINGDKAFLDAVGYEDRGSDSNSGKELVDQVKQKLGAGT